MDKKFSEKELEEIRKQLPDYSPDSTIEKLAIGFVDEIVGNFAELRLRGHLDETITLSISSKYIQQKGLDEAENKFFALVEYKSTSGQKLEIVRLSKLK